MKKQSSDADHHEKKDVPSALFGLVSRKQRWALSWKGWVLLVFVSFGLAALLVVRVHPFLAVTQRVDTDVLVVEGWIPEYAIRVAASEFRKGSYHRVFSTGGPVHGAGPYTNDYSTSASIGAGLLKNAGLPPELVQMVPSRVRDRDRTYSAAIALRDWFREHDQTVTRINVLTEGVHARRSRLLFQKAFGKRVDVGVIAVPNPDYDAGYWWHYSEGVKEIVSEGAAYLYVRFFFSPKPVGTTHASLMSVSRGRSLASAGK